MTTTVIAPARPQILALRDGRVLDWRDRPLVMGVLNITPDSFSDGGRWLEPDAALDRAQRMIQEGADLLDLGAESTRPGGGVYGQGAEAVPAAVELDRLLPVLERLRESCDLPISVDTRKGEVAQAALAAGADLINDISGLTDSELGAAVAAAGCPVVLMHSRGHLSSMQRGIDFTDVVAEVTAELGQKVEKALALGIEERQILVDPGIGFGKTKAQNLRLLRGMKTLHSLDLPLLIGASRKSFIGEIDGAGPTERLAGSLAAVAWAAHSGAAVVRVHDVADTRQFLAVWQAISSAGGSWS